MGLSKATLLAPDEFNFPKENRLLVPSDYQRVFKQGHKRRAGVFTLFICRNEFKHARLGLAIAKRHEPLAVERNRVRRIIRESFRHYQMVLKGMDIVVLLQKSVHELNNACLHQHLKSQWQSLIA